MAHNWQPDSWREDRFEAKHLPHYEDESLLAEAEGTLAGYPPLVFAGEARQLKSRLAGVVAGEAFLLQGGDCAESFAEFSPNNIRDTFRVILQMAAVLTFASKMPVVKVGRMAGQFAKPRSSDTETQGQTTLPSYFGDNVNASSSARRRGVTIRSAWCAPTARRRGDAQPAARLCRRRLCEFAPGPPVDARFYGRSPGADKYRNIADRIGESLDFMEACGIDPENTPQLKTASFYTSHEALLLPYEQAMTRQDSLTGDWFDTSAHFLWVGDRTRFEDSAHVEFLRGVGNPLGMKCGPSLEPDALLSLLDILNPAREPGRITLIARFGHDKVEAGLPRWVRAVEREGHPVVWSCDPMHGNVVKSDSGYKTRPFDRILSEVKGFFAVHRAEGTYAGGGACRDDRTGRDRMHGGARWRSPTRVWLTAITRIAIRD